MPVVAARADPEIVATEHDRSDGQRHADRPVAGDVYEMVEPEQQRSDQRR